MTKVLPTFGATVVDFFAHTALLAGSSRCATQDGGGQGLAAELPVGAARLPRGLHLALLVAGLYLWLGVPGMLLGIPPLYLIYYSYDIYVKRAQERR